MIESIIHKRRSVFPDQYNGKPVSKEIIEKLLEAANTAPTHKRTEPWRFKVVRGDMLEKLGLFLSYKYLETEANPKEFKARKLIENPKKASAIILICMQKDPQERLPVWEEVAAVAMAVQNMYLCCAEWEIGCYWSSPGIVKYMGEFVDLNDGEECLGLFYLGRYDSLPEAVPRGSVTEKTAWL